MKVKKIKTKKKIELNKPTIFFMCLFLAFCVGIIFGLILKNALI